MRTLLWSRLQILLQEHQILLGSSLNGNHIWFAKAVVHKHVWGNFLCKKFLIVQGRKEAEPGVYPGGPRRLQLPLPKPYVLRGKVVKEMASSCPSILIFSLRSLFFWLSPCSELPWDQVLIPRPIVRLRASARPDAHASRKLCCMVSRDHLNSEGIVRILPLVSDIDCGNWQLKQNQQGMKPWQYPNSQIYWKSNWHAWMCEGAHLGHPNGKRAEKWSGTYLAEVFGRTAQFFFCVMQKGGRTHTYCITPPCRPLEIGRSPGSPSKRYPKRYSLSGASQ